jgi:hypothetical protein
MNPQAHLTYKSTTVRADEILDIVQRKTDHLSFPFTINIYTSYSSVEETSKEIKNNMIGQFLAKNATEIFHVFLTPDIEKNNLIRINALKSVGNLVKFDKHNLFANTLITEGDKNIFCKNSKEVLMNQKFCICDHEETQQYSPSKQDKNLGIIPHFIVQKVLNFYPALIIFSNFSKQQNFSLRKSRYVKNKLFWHLYS